MAHSNPAYDKFIII